MTTHKCHIPGCAATIPEHLLFCAPHWKMTPIRNRNLIWRHYRKGQEIDKKPSRDYITAMRDAIEAVQKLEGQPGLL